VISEDARHHRLRARIAGMPARRWRPPAHHHTVLGGRRFHWLEWGASDRPALVFLHGGAQTARTWDLVCHELARERRCIALDLRGHGESEWSYELDYSIEAHAGDLEAFVREIGIEDFVLVGMSLGGIVALRWSLDRCDALAGLVFVDCGPWVRPEGGRRIGDFVRRAAQLETIEDYVEAAIRFNPRRDPRLLRHSLLHNLRRLPSGGWTWKHDRRAPFEPQGAERMLAPLRPGLRRLRCPVLIVRGAESDVFLDEDAERFARALPDAVWQRIPGAGHTVQGDNPRALTAALEAFLAERSRWSSAP
jgi:esterase